MLDPLTVSTECDNGLGIRASVGTDGHRYFSIEEASRLTGIDSSSGHRRWKDSSSTLRGPDGRQRKYVSADLVDEERSALRTKLGLVEKGYEGGLNQVVDDSRGSGGIEDLAAFVTVDSQLGSIVRDLLVAEDLMSDELELERRRNQIYRDALRQLLPLENEPAG